MENNAVAPVVQEQEKLNKPVEQQAVLEALVPVAQPEQKNEKSKEKLYEETLSRARKMRFHNPGFAAKLAIDSDKPGEELTRLATEQPYMIGARVNPSNPAVDREIPCVANRIRNAIRAKRIRLFK